MQRIIYSRQNDSIDSISWRYYGTSQVEHILAANPHIHKHDAILPIATPVVLPNIVTETVKKQTLQLWE